MMMEWISLPQYNRRRRQSPHTLAHCTRSSSAATTRVFGSKTNAMAWLVTTLCLLLPLLGLLYLYVRRKYAYWAHRNVPFVPGALPMGSFNGMGTKKHFVDLLNPVYEQYRKTHSAVGMFLCVNPVQLLMQLKNKGTIEEDEEDSKETITMNDVIAQAFLFFFGGFETSSKALSFALFELAYNQEIQDKARDEVQRVLVKHEGLLTYEALKDMVYVEQIVHESLRKYAPIGNIVRVANEPYEISKPDFTLEKGTMVMIPIHSIHHDPDIYPDPSRFDPDRFTPEAINGRPSHSSLPFGHGPRNCIGMRFALLEVKFGIAQLVSRLRFTVNEKTQLPLQYDPKANVATALGGLWLDVERI